MISRGGRNLIYTYGRRPPGFSSFSTFLTRTSRTCSKLRVRPYAITCLNSPARMDDSVVAGRGVNSSGCSRRTRFSNHHVARAVYSAPKCRGARVFLPQSVRWQKAKHAECGQPQVLLLVPPPLGFGIPDSPLKKHDQKFPAVMDGRH